MRVYTLRKEFEAIKRAANGRRIPTTDASGKRCWIEGRGAGILFYCDFLKLTHDAGRTLAFSELPEDMQTRAALWSRAEVDGYEYRGISRACREAARALMGAGQDERT